MANYLFFSTPTCIKCPAVKEYLKTVSMTGVHIDASTSEGLDKARELSVMATPTVVIFDDSDKEIKRAQSLPEVRLCFQ